MNPDQPTTKIEKEIAFDRDRFAADRTILAWIRTSISLIGFGFSIFKFFQLVKELHPLGAQTTIPSGTKNFGIALVALGVIFLILATFEYIAFIKRLCHKACQPFVLSASLMASFFLSIVGLIALVSMLFEIELF